MPYIHDDGSTSFAEPLWLCLTPRTLTSTILAGLLTPPFADWGRVPLLTRVCPISPAGLQGFRHDGRHEPVNTTTDLEIVPKKRLTVIAGTDEAN